MMISNYSIKLSISIWLQNFTPHVPYIYIYIYMYTYIHIYGTSYYNELTIYCHASDTIKVEIHGEFLMARFSLSKYMWMEIIQLS